jgi:hypothetical protein
LLFPSLMLPKKSSSLSRRLRGLSSPESVLDDEIYEIKTAEMGEIRSKSGMIWYLILKNMRYIVRTFYVQATGSGKSNIDNMLTTIGYTE